MQHWPDLSSDSKLARNSLKLAMGHQATIMLSLVRKTQFVKSVCVCVCFTLVYTNITCINSCFDPVKSTRELSCVQSYYSIRLPLLLLVQQILKY